MRRTASEIVRNLEIRVARLERNASRFSKRANTKPFALVELVKTDTGWGLKAVVDTPHGAKLEAVFKSSNSPAVEEALKSDDLIPEEIPGHKMVKEGGCVVFGIHLHDSKAIMDLIKSLGHNFTLVEGDEYNYRGESMMTPYERNNVALYKPFDLQERKTPNLAYGKFNKYLLSFDEGWAESIFSGKAKNKTTEKW